MKDIRKVQDVVEDVLETEPYTRNSDTYLYAEVCKKINPDIAYMGFLYVFNNRADLGIPKMETVRRARQKLQAERDDLKASDSVTDSRYENWKTVKEYAVE